MALVLGCLRIPYPFFDSLYIHQIFQVCLFLLNLVVEPQRNILETKKLGQKRPYPPAKIFVEFLFTTNPLSTVRLLYTVNFFELTAIKIEGKGRFWNSCSFT